MRNWNPAVGSHWVPSQCVWIVPMRNWNADRAGRFAASAFVWIVPMRNWNHVQRCRHDANTSFESYLWGIETTWTGTISSTSSGFESYLWGIETIIASMPSRLSEKFESYLWGIETGLQHCRLWRYQRLNRTYEELKQEQKTESDATSNVWIVPMRNWNLQTWFDNSHTDDPFESYLWGIETFQIHPYLPAGEWVWIVPMRNWNSVSPEKVEYTFPVWIVPMRNWNFRTVTPERVQSGLNRTYDELKLHVSPNSIT